VSRKCRSRALSRAVPSLRGHRSVGRWTCRRASRGRERTTGVGPVRPGCPTWSFGAASSATVRSGRAHNAHLPRGLRIGESGRATSKPRMAASGRLGRVRCVGGKLRGLPAERRVAAPARPETPSTLAARRLRYPGHHGMEEVRGSSPLSSTRVMSRVMCDR
jgi:hypothetical protein